MLDELRRKPLIALDARAYRVARWLMAGMAALCLASAVFLLLAFRLPDPDGRRILVLWFLLLGLPMAFWSWKGRWTPSVTEDEKARDARWNVRIEPIIAGAELLCLSLALFGLLAPSVVGDWWKEYRSSVVFFLVLAALDLVLRVSRHRRRAAVVPDSE